MIRSSFTYNGITFYPLVRTSGFKAEFVNGSRVGIRDTITAIPGFDGVERYKSFYKDRLVEIRGFVLGESEEDLYNNIALLEKAFDIHNLEEEILDGFSPLEFTDPGQNTGRYYCKPIQNTLSIIEKKTGFSRAFAILLEAKDPRKYEISEITVTATPSIISGTSALPFTIPVVISGDAYTGNASINNTGDAGVIPTQIKIYGPCTGPIVTNTTKDEHIELTGDVVLTDTDYIIILPQEGTIYKYDSVGTGVNIIKYLTSDSIFWNLAKGNNSITYTADSMSQPSRADITVRLTI